MGTTLKMEVDIANETALTMERVHGELKASFDAMSTAVTNLIQGGNWQGNSAQEFDTLYGEWRGAMDGVLEQLESHAASLKNEISNWTAAAEKLGG